MNQTLIRILEELTFNAWPARHQLLDDGWVLRLTDGYTKRANSINPLYDSQQPVETKIERCVQLYHNYHLPPVFRLTPLAQPTDLDARLADLGLTRQSPTSVQWLDLASLTPQTPAAFGCEANLSTEWLDHFSDLSGKLTQRAAHRTILSNILPPRCFATVSHRGQVVACGLGVFERATVGLFDLVTEAQARRQGFAQALLSGILQWGIERGATQAYLQVEMSNHPALNLYRKLGFSEVYHYWYRVGER